MADILIRDLTEEEKRKMDIAKARSDSKTWKDFFLDLINKESR